MSEVQREGGSAPRHEVLGLSFLFGTLYFVQGIVEPTEGLIAQPVRSLVKSWGYGTQDIAAFTAILSLPWALKPIYGLISDFLPLRGSHRRSWLILTTAVTVIGLLVVWLAPPPEGAGTLLLCALMVPTVAVAFSDVVVDALMVEEGQPRALTGRLQSVQWAALYAAAILTGWLGGWLSQHAQARMGFAICAGATMVSFIVTLLVVREPAVKRPAASAGRAVKDLRSVAQTPLVLGVIFFLFLWNFNPFTASVRYMHMTVAMGMSEQLYGNTVSLDAIAAVIASVAYGFYCRRLSLHALLHLTVALGVLSTLAWWGMVGERSALIVTFAAGFVYMTATLTQLDLAARACPPHLAGTVFALLMAVSNLGASGAIWLGGIAYEHSAKAIGATPAFDALVAVGAAFTAACWFVVPWLLRASLRGNL
ncbi:MAG: MFS transporter [Methylococcales bacterium]